MASTTDAFQDRRDALIDLRSARRHNRIATLDKFDAFYKAYFFGLLGTVAVYAASGWFGDSRITGSALHRISTDGAAWLGLVVALAVGIGIRSGGRGGPMAFEHADVRHVLLSPVDRGASIRKPAIARLLHVASIGTVVGGAVGIVALRRLPHLPFLWIICGALLGAAIGATAFGIGLVLSGRQISRHVADSASFLLLAWSGADVYWHVKTSPSTWIGSIAIWPLHFDVFGIAGLVVVAAIIAAGIVLIPGSSVEAAERRSKLVGQLRFAATLQDVRTVMVLQRQLSQEHIRQHAWFRLPRSKQTRPTAWVFYRRSFADLLRWPIFRMVRLVVMVAIAAACAWAAWAGESALIVVSGIALWLGALDLLEPLAQETDHSDRLRSIPRPAGWVMGRLLIIPFFVLLALVFIACIPVVMVGNPTLISALWPLAFLAAWMPIGAAALTVTRQPDFASGSIQAPEVAGLKTLWNVFGPPALAVSAFIPLIIAHRSWEVHHSADQVLKDINYPMAAVLAAASWSVAWIRFGSQIRSKYVAAGVRTVAGEDAAKRVPKA